MKYTEIQSQLERIKIEISSEDDGVKLKKLLREKLNEIGILLYEYTNPMLSKVKSEKNAHKDQGKSRSVTNNFGVVTNNNCPSDGQKGNLDSLLLGPQTDLKGVKIGPFGTQEIQALNNLISTNVNFKN